MLNFSLVHHQSIHNPQLILHLQILILDFQVHQLQLHLLEEIFIFNKKVKMIFLKKLQNGPTIN